MIDARISLRPARVLRITRRHERYSGDTTGACPHTEVAMPLLREAHVWRRRPLRHFPGTKSNRSARCHRRTPYHARRRRHARCRQRRGSTHSAIEGAVEKLRLPSIVRLFDRRSVLASGFRGIWRRQSKRRPPMLKGRVTEEAFALSLGLFQNQWKGLTTK